MATTVRPSDILTAQWQGDPLKQFHPLPVQLPFLKAVLSADPPYENLYCGSNRSGKTLGGAYCGAVLARRGPDSPRVAVGSRTQVWDRATSGWVIGPDYPTLRDTLMPLYFDNGYVSPTQTLRPFIPPEDIARWSWDNQVLQLKNGSIIGFKSNEQSASITASAISSR
jgi:hypothetical protein